MPHYEVIVEDRFNATHQLRLGDGAIEPLHGHDWHVRAYFRSDRLDAQGMVVDFHHAQQALRGVLSNLQYTLLNELPAFRERNPTAEVVAEHVLVSLRKAGLPETSRVEVTEAPGCVAAYQV